MRSLLTATALTAALALAPLSQAHAFCGFFVARADADLYNKASQVVLARDGQYTAITMASDYTGTPRDFAMVIPVPEVPAQSDISVIEPRLIADIDAYSAPRLVEYFDENPCAGPNTAAPALAMMADGAARDEEVHRRRDAATGVTIEAEYQVGEYDILILSAEESQGLTTWLTANDYRIPDGAGPILDSYLRQDMKFFVAKVNLENHDASGRAMLRPIQVRYESPKFMVPVRLGTVNADGPQELLIYALSTRGQVRPVNYRTVEIPSEQEVPLFVKDDFGSVYQAMFDRQVARHGVNVVHLEYAWNGGACDPCAAPPLPVADLEQLGVRWVSAEKNAIMAPTFVTRLHVRYTADSLPEDLMFQETDNQAQVQGRYILRHPVATAAAARCQLGRAYLASLPRRFETEAETLAAMTGWEVNSIRARMEQTGQSFTPIALDDDGRPWWEKIED